MIGVPAYRDAGELTFLKSLVLPFQKQRVWELPDGTVPTRSHHVDRDADSVGDERSGV